MGGQAGGRGYLIQAVIAVLDALIERDWAECVLEPNLGEDKIDLLLRSPDGDRVSQIKSSQNAFGAPQVRAWAESLEAAYPGAKRYELRLIGPVTSSWRSLSRVGNVEIPVPQAFRSTFARYLSNAPIGSTDISAISGMFQPDQWLASCWRKRSRRGLGRQPLAVRLYPEKL